MAEVSNWTSEYCTTLGTGSLVLSGPVQEAATFASAIPAGKVWYSIVDDMIDVKTQGERGAAVGYDRTELSGIVADLDARLIRAAEKTDLPETPDIDRINSLLVDLRGKSVLCDIEIVIHLESEPERCGVSKVDR